MVCVHDFRDLCPRLSPQGSLGESRRSGIWALQNDSAQPGESVGSLSSPLLGWVTICGQVNHLGIKSLPKPTQPSIPAS